MAHGIVRQMLGWIIAWRRGCSQCVGAVMVDGGWALRPATLAHYGGVETLQEVRIVEDGAVRVGTAMIVSADVSLTGQNNSLL